MRVSRLTLAATAILAAEALALLVIALVELSGLGSGDAASLPSGLGLIGLTVVGAIGIGALSFAVWKGRSFGRSGGMVVQILAVLTALSSLGVRPFPLGFVLALAVPGAVGAVLLFLLSRREGAANRRRADQADDGGGQS
ncbi:hypothetical protein [uncultured Microbacterium sp.]|uniref:hypothetical protein n=1 Tax=uncultured Microbacterium sp. TaxID=191216 RepID=UPI0025D2BC8C|nr:hypothetical protein [uncultured Microbacterium sp.]